MDLTVGSGREYDVPQDAATVAVQAAHAAHAAMAEAAAFLP